MCLSIQRQCSCSGDVASLFHTNSVLPEEVVVAVHCPSCSDAVDFDQATMLRDNGWIIEYDLELAAQHLRRFGIDPQTLTPERIFDEGYSTWKGLTPTDAYQKSMELHALWAEAEGDRRKYFEDMKKWTIERTQRLAEAGWRKAQAAL